MKNLSAPRQQQGAALFIALVMLLVLTVLAISSMRGVTLESRITANRVEASRLQNLADAALREGEFRFYGPAFLREKLEPELANCKKSNTLNRHGNNKPCLLAEIPDEEMLAEYFSKPLTFFLNPKWEDYTKEYEHKTGAATESAANGAIVAWMPYRGLDSEKYFVADKEKPYWNSYRIISGATENEGINVTSGDVLQGKGVYFFLVTAQSNDQLAAQSTLAVTYLGLN